MCGVYAKELAQLPGMDDADFTGWTGLGASLQGTRLTEGQKDVPESSRALGG